VQGQCLRSPDPFTFLVLCDPSSGGMATAVSVGAGDTLQVRRGGELRTVRLACIAAMGRLVWRQKTLPGPAPGTFDGSAEQLAG
jgi:hypothetical protein